MLPSAKRELNVLAIEATGRCELRGANREPRTFSVKESDGLEKCEARTANRELLNDRRD